MKKTKNKKGQVYLIMVIIAIVFALVSSFIMINYTSSEKGKDEYIGVYQSGMIDAIVDGDKLLMYVEQAAKYVADKSLQDTASNGFVELSAETGEDNPGPKCKTYVYNLWNTESKECFPHIENGLGFYFDKSLNEKLSTYNDRNMKRTIEREYYFESSFSKTKISALAQGQFIIDVFKSKEYKENVETQKYIDNKQATAGLTINGNFIWPLKGNSAYILSCFGYRGGVSAGGGKKGTTNHAGIDLPQPKGTPVYAVAAGTIYAIQTSWNAVIINHGGGLKTTYGHLSKIDVKVGEVVTQGQKIGEVGDKASPSHFHLHFEVVQDNIDLNTLYKGIPAIIERSSQKKINPLCMYGKQFFDDNKMTLTYEKNFGCTNICNPDKNTCADTTSCDTKYGCLFKFCEAYGAIVPADANCQVKANTNWKISNIDVSQKEVTGDKTIKITTTIENSDVECASVAPRTIINSDGQSQYVFDGQKKTDVYKDNQGKNYKNIVIECSFITDKNKLATERGPDKCVLLAPTDGSKMKYTVVGGAKDAMGRDERSQTATFEVTKPGTTGQTGNGTQQTIIHDFSMLITDAEFRDVSITQLDIQKFLEKRGSVLKDPIDGKLPSQVIYDISKKNGVNPILVIVTLQKEQSLITLKTATKEKLNKAMGCGCPDTGPCDPKYYGFENQVKCGVESVYIRHFNAGLKNSYPFEFKGINYNGKCPKNSNTGQSSIAVQNAATYALYKYTPHTYDICQGDGKLGGGNYLFLAMMKQYYKDITGKEYGTGTGSLNSQYQQVAIDEIEGKGIIGKYYVKPSFTVDIPFDLSLVDNLSLFMNQTVVECRFSPLGKEKCLDAKIVEFNNNTGKYYKSNGINIELSRECDTSLDEKSFNEFMESVEDCALSVDFDCQCDLKKSSSLKVDVDSENEFAYFSYTKSGITHDVTSYNVFLDSSNNPLVLSSSMNTINLHKKLGLLKSGAVFTKKCSIPESRFRLCLKTDYKTKEYNGQTLVEKNVTINFAVSIKDNDAPPPITNLELSNMKHSKNSVMIVFDESKKNNQKVPDVASYTIYMSDVAADFNNDIKTIRTNVKYRTLDVLNSGYEKVQALDLTKNPECEIINDTYCNFFYNAKDSNGADIIVELSEDKLYYMIDKEKFIYILNGSDSYNALNSGRDKYIAVTAVDMDGNEINNINTTQKITLGQNLQNIKPIDNLAPGFVIATATVNTVTNRIYLTYERPLVFITGEPMDNTPILYRAYIDWNCQNQNNQNFCNVITSLNPTAETGTLTMDIDRTMVARVGVIPVIRNNNIDAQYNSGFTETVIGSP